MNYSKSTQNEISKYLNAVRKNMQHAPAEEVDEVILHLQEQMHMRYFHCNLLRLNQLLILYIRLFLQHLNLQLLM